MDVKYEMDGAKMLWMQTQHGMVGFCSLDVQCVVCMDGYGPESPSSRVGYVLWDDQVNGKSKWSYARISWNIC
jgi:hypothetical protein